MVDYIYLVVKKGTVNEVFNFIPNYLPSKLTVRTCDFICEELTNSEQLGKYTYNILAQGLSLYIGWDDKLLTIVAAT